MNLLEGCRILLALSGGIAAYKGAGIVRHLRAQGAEVRVIMTKSACEFITPLTLEVLSEQPVVTELFRPGDESEIGHIELARWPHVVLVAPATANVLAKARYGIADDLLTTVLLATTAPVLFCPAMNTQMLLHPATQENLEALRGRPRTHVLSPDAGSLACGEVGAGRLPDPDVIEEALLDVLTPKRLAGLDVLITAGPTREFFDPVRFLSNPSTGMMGYAVARAARRMGARVTLVSGPTSLARPLGVDFVPVVSAEQMREEVFARRSDICVMSAAVADWTPVDPAAHKRKKTDGSWLPELTRTTDILASLSASDRRPKLLIGFAAETQDVERYAREKLQKKHIDGIVANNVGGVDGAFGNERNEVFLIDPGETRQLASAPKIRIAEDICEWIAKLYGERA